MDSNTRTKIIFFDGVCHLCDGWVSFVLKRDKTQQFKFCAIQSAKSLEYISVQDQADLSTIIYYDNGKVYKHSTAVLRILKDLGSYWRLFYILWIIPSFLRNFVYKLVARYRYAMFGKRSECRIPNDDDASRFLDLSYN